MKLDDVYLKAKGIEIKGKQKQKDHELYKLNKLKEAARLKILKDEEII